MAKCEYICLSAEEMEKLKKDCDSTSKTTKKKKTTKTTKKKAKTPQKVRKTAKKTAAPKRTATRTVTKKKKAVIKSKNKNVNRNRNVNNNAVSVNVRANPKAVSNIYIVRPAQQPVVEAPRKKKRDIPYDAPFLPRRTPDGGLIQTASAPRQRTVYIQQSTPQPEIFLEQEQSSGRSIGESSKKLLSAGAKAGRGIVSAGRNAVGKARNRRTRTEYEVDYPVTIDQAETVPALPSPSAKAEVLPADYELPKNTKKI